mmetsp:Transcript_13715/g.41370  ORF Transcript_13715/g.41370 Transcript_13715/m.41370 type:complete len:273 (-) Transcript_13715:40-858(-)
MVRNGSIKVLRIRTCAIFTVRWITDTPFVFVVPHLGRSMEESHGLQRKVWYRIALVHMTEASLGTLHAQHREGLVTDTRTTIVPNVGRDVVLGQFYHTQGGQCGTQRVTGDNHIVVRKLLMKCLYDWHHLWREVLPGLIETIVHRYVRVGLEWSEFGILEISDPILQTAHLCTTKRNNDLLQIGIVASVAVGVRISIVEEATGLEGTSGFVGLTPLACPGVERLIGTIRRIRVQCVGVAGTVVPLCRINIGDATRGARGPKKRTRGQRQQQQ